MILQKYPKLEPLHTVTLLEVVVSSPFCVLFFFVWKLFRMTVPAVLFFTPCPQKSVFVFVWKLFRMTDSRMTTSNSWVFKNTPVSGKPHPCTPLTNCPLEKTTKGRALRRLRWSGGLALLRCGGLSGTRESCRTCQHHRTLFGSFLCVSTFGTRLYWVTWVCINKNGMLGMLGFERHPESKNKWSFFGWEELEERVFDWILLVKPQRRIERRGLDGMMFDMNIYIYIWIHWCIVSRCMCYTTFDYGYIFLVRI